MKYLVSFYNEEDINSDIAIAIRGKLEELSPNTWIQIFPNLLLIQSDLATKDIYLEVDSVAKGKRFIVAEVSNQMVSESRSESLIAEYGY